MIQDKGIETHTVTKLLNFKDKESLGSYAKMLIYLQGGKK